MQKEPNPTRGDWLQHVPSTGCRLVSAEALPRPSEFMPRSGAAAALECAVRPLRGHQRRGGGPDQPSRQSAMPRQASARVRLPEEECWDPGLFVVNSSSSETEVSSQWRLVKQTFESQLVLAVAPLGSKQVFVSTHFSCVCALRHDRFVPK